MAAAIPGAVPPGVSGDALSITVDNTYNVAQAVVQGIADLGFVEGVIDEPTLSVEAVAEDRMVAVVAPDHPWAAGKVLRPAQLLAAQWILREEGSGTRSAFESALAAYGVSIGALQIALSLPSNEAVRSAVMAGPFATVMSELVIGFAPEGGLARQGKFQNDGARLPDAAAQRTLQSKASLAFEQLIRASRT